MKRFIVFHGKRHPAQMGKAEVTAFLTHLAVQRDVAVSTQNQALSAILFLYRDVLELELGWVEGFERPKRPACLPVVLTPAEARAQAGQLPCVSPLVRNTSARERLRHTHGTGAAWPCGCVDHNDLHACHEQRRTRREKSARLA